MVAEDEYWEADGIGELCLHLLVDPARVRAMLGWDSISHHQIDSLLDDLVQTLVKAFEAKGETYPARSNIVAMVAPAREGGLPDGALLYPERSGGIAGKPKPYLKVSFGAIWSRLLRQDLLTRYNLRALVKLRYGFSQAVARFCLTHQSANYSVTRLAEILGAERRVDKLRRELEEDEAGLQALGIVLHDGVVKLAGKAAEPRRVSTEPRRLAA